MASHDCRPEGARLADPRPCPLGCGRLEHLWETCAGERIVRVIGPHAVIDTAGGPTCPRCGSLDAHRLAAHMDSPGSPELEAALSAPSLFDHDLEEAS